MVKTIVLGDLHACPQALEQILTSGNLMGAERYVILGDVFGYGPSPITRFNPSGEKTDKKGCLELLEGRFYEKKVARKGSVSYILIPNRHVLLGNHGRMVLEGVPEGTDKNARASIEDTWKEIGVEGPIVPGEADKIAEGIHRGIKRPKK